MLLFIKYMFMSHTLVSLSLLIFHICWVAGTTIILAMFQKYLFINLPFKLVGMPKSCINSISCHITILWTSQEKTQKVQLFYHAFHLNIRIEYNYTNYPLVYNYYNIINSYGCLVFYFSYNKQ